MKTLKILFPLILIPTLIGCGGGTTLIQSTSISVGQVSTTKSDYISYSCVKCDGTLTYRLTVKESQALEIKSTAKIEKGALTVTLINAKDEEKYKQIIVEDLNYIIPLEEYGKYKISVVCDDFKGNFTFSWSK